MEGEREGKRMEMGYTTHFGSEPEWSNQHIEDGEMPENPKYR